ncbi:LOW QUALITY PROTEIN: scavenger receptor cysteine-rich type 1 protein M130 [Amphiprion ocellaris]|nr:LOW QUALITY PROTEIN: scavenger receptor cysteine-rich type 1 protein M130 [Amphiprion ocellaris]
MWFLLLLHIAHIQPAISQAAGKRLVLRNGSNPCEGHVEVFYNNEWGLVGDKLWSRETEEVVCSSTHCGEPVGNATENVRRLWDSKVWLNELQCNGSQKQLWDCDSPGWGISYYQKPFVRKITCSRNITFSLEGSRCAGAVRYSDGGTLAGYICYDNNWGDDEARKLCEQLGCGGLKKRPTPGQMSGEAFQSLSGNMTLNCAGMNRIDNLWQCAAPASCQYPAAVICSDHESLRLTERCSGTLQKETNGKWEDVNDSNVSPDVRCQQMHCGGARGNVTDSKLTCTDDVKVVLVNNNNDRCYGTVHAEINGIRKAVCGSSWTKQADVVCKELGCGTVNSVSTRSSSPGIMDFVECLGNELSLWHCEAKHGENLPCSRVPYIVCSASLKVRLADGGGRCAGRLEVKHEGQWKRVLQNQAWTNQHSNIICKQLKCGMGVVPENSVKYSQGSGSFLTVDCKSDISKKQKITACIITDSGNNGQSAVGITCEDHKALFLSGSCSGEVGIKNGSKTFWLSDVDWNQDVANTVCQQMHCGNAVPNTNSTSRADEMEVWSLSYNCSRNETSLFECANTTIPSDVNQNASIASVTCSGEIHLKLTKRCWGNVEISMEGKSGGICADTWTEDNSRMLCEEQGCENNVLKSLSLSPRQAEIMVLSLHAMQPTANLSQYNFIMKQDNDRTCQKPASVVCSGSIEPTFSVSRDSCSGSLELLYEESWLPVCTEALSDVDTRNTICRTLNCGQAIENSLDFGPTPASRQVITQIQCSTNATSLKECNVTSETRSCTLGVLKCSGWKTMVLEHDEPCKGEVVIYSAGKVSAVSSEGWTKSEGQRLCQDMTCGSPIQLEEKVPWPTDSFFNGSFSCAGKPQSIWECEKKVPPSEKKLFIECQNEAQVTLSQECHGELRINNTQVCNSQWKPDYSNRVCQELSCSNAMDFTEKGKPRPEGMYHHIHCDEYHFKLGQCRRVRGSCNSASLVEIVCVGSIKFSTTEKCGGNIQVSYRDKWKEVCIQKDLTIAMKHQLCQKMNCGNYNSSFNSRNTEEKELEMSLECTDNHLDIKHCVKKKTCKRVPAEIYCQDYERPIIITEDEPSSLPIILGVSFLLVLLVVVAVGTRFYVTRRNRKLNPARMLPGKEMEFESGEYEDVVNRDDEMEDARGGRFRSDAEFFREDDRRSASSLPYDDIDEAIEAQPLNPPANTTRASNMQEDKVTYEVEDPPENYDDIDDITKAEVHDGPKPTADRDAAAAPPGPVPGGEDYLVPGQDG